MSIQFRALEIFCTIVEYNGFTKAAEALYVGQPTLSKTVQKLEQLLNVTLFDRTNRQIQLTDAGKVVYQKSREILAQVDSIPIVLNELSNVVTGEIKIGVPPIIGTVFFPQIASVFLNKYPNVNITTKEAGGVIIENIVEESTLDLGLVVLPTINESLDWELFYKDEFVLCVSSNHPVASYSKIDLISIKDENFILFDQSFALYKLIMDKCLESGFTPAVSFQSSQWDLILELVSAELGVTIIPKILTDRLTNINIVSIPIKKPDLVWRIGFITKKNAYKSYALKAFIKTIRETWGNIK